MQWFASRNGKTFGPFTLQQLQQMASTGKLIATDFVCESGKSWVSAGSLPQYFAFAAVAMPPPPPSPQVAAVATAAPLPQTRHVAGSIGCQVCGQGAMQKKKLYRLSGPAVLIGWIFLVPSFLGMALSILAIGGCSSAHTDAHQSIDKQFIAELRRDGLPSSIVGIFERGDFPTESQLATLNTDQRRKLQSALAGRSGGHLGAAAGAGMIGFAGMGLFIASLVGGLLGWILTMKKRVLQCTRCQSVIAAG